MPFRGTEPLWRARANDGASTLLTHQREISRALRCKTIAGAAWLRDRDVDRDGTAHHDAEPLDFDRTADEEAHVPRETGRRAIERDVIRAVRSGRGGAADRRADRDAHAAVAGAR